MKPERVQIFARLASDAKSCAQKIWEVLDWIESIAAALKDFFGSGSNK